MEQANLRPLPKDDLSHVLAATQELWLKHNDARIFLTGGTGFFGKWLQETFAFAKRELSLPANLVVLTRDPSRAAREMAHRSDASIEYVAGDVRDFKDPNGSFSHVIHAATPVSGLWDQSQALEVLETNFHGTKRVLEFAAHQRNARFLLVSSGAVYGPQPMERVPETYFGGPDSASLKSAYAEGKRAAETLTNLYSISHRLDVSIARCFAFIGPHLPLDAGYAAGQFLARTLKGESIEISGTGTDLRSYMHAADLSVWIWTILFSGERNSLFNVGSADSTSIADLAEKIAQLGGSEVKIQGKAVGNPSRYVPDVSKAERELGLKVRIGLDDGLKRTFDWLKTDA